MITLPWVYGPDITTCCYKGLLQNYIMLCYSFLNKRSSLVVLRFPAQTSPLALCGYVTKYDHKVWCSPHSTEHDTPPIAYLISKQTVPYRTRGGTCCPGVPTPKIRSLVDSSMTNHFTWWVPPSLPFQPCSNHNIDPHHGQITSRRMGDHLSQRHKPSSTP
jgi:hypothetical protein